MSHRAELAAFCLLALAAPSPRATAQGVASGSIRGTVRSPDGLGLEEASIRVINVATGFSARTRVRRDRFRVEGLEPGGPYVVEVRHLGFLPQRSPPLHLTLGEPLDLDFVLQPAPVQLEPIEVNETSPGPRLGGTNGATIPDALVHRLPTLNRNFYDFVSLAPLVSTKIGAGRAGVSAAGANHRFNSFLINGADERFVNGNVSAAANVGKSVPLDAVKEYQVLVAPWDVRFGDFAGGMVNTVTESGTNELHGSTFGYWRNDRLAGGSPGLPGQPYDRLQYGFSLGGPIVRDRVHFFVAPELQRLTQPAAGPYLGQPAAQLPPVPAREADLARLTDILATRYGLAAGSGGYVENGIPLLNFYGRVDAAIPEWNGRLMGFVTYARSRQEQLSRSATDTFPLSSYQIATDAGVRLIGWRLDTDLPRAGGGHNELIVSLSADHMEQVPDVRQPLVRVLLQGTSGGGVIVNAGSAAEAQGRFGRSHSSEVRDHFSLAWGGGHVVEAGLELERFEVLRGGVSGGYGVWTFASLDALELGTPQRYELRKDFGSASTPLRGGQYGAYLGDEWRVARRLTLTLGVRGDLLAVAGHAPYNAEIDSIFGRRTDRMPGARIHVSPRVGFTWDLSAARRERLRGGLGVFTGRPPLAWLVPALANYGLGVGVLSCGFLPTDAGPPPVFVPDYRSAPTRCAQGPDLQARPYGDVDLLARDLSLARTLRGSLSYERELPGGVQAGAEFQMSRQLSDFIWVNLNLQGPQGVDRFGRVLYGTIGANGIAQPALRSAYAEVIDLRNTSRNSSRQLTVRAERRFSGGLAAVVSYTYSRVRDVQSPSRVNQAGIALWADARALSGRHDDLTPGISLNDLPHRVVAALTYTAPWRRWPTQLSFYYVGESGSPFTYITTGAGRRGDLNADGSNANDPIYVPRSALDTTEIRFEPFVRAAPGGAGFDTVSVASQAEAFDGFIDRTPCLRRRRGSILQRNGCREPWTHTTIASVRQGVPLGRHLVEVELDLFNVLNLLNARWGQYRVSRPRVLEHVGQTTTDPLSAQPIFQFDFDPTRSDWDILPTESAFQFQLAVRYRF
jgi:hypothetical protein